MRALGVDFGERRIGLALSDPTGTLASPWRTMSRSGGDDAVVSVLAREIAILQQEPDGLSVVVVGLPARLDGTPSELTERVTRLAHRLRGCVVVPVVLQDERLSSHEAESRLALRERDWRRRKARLDAASAAVILQDYLDHTQPAVPVEPSDPA